MKRIGLCSLVLILFSMGVQANDFYDDESVKLRDVDCLMLAGILVEAYKPIPPFSANERVSMQVLLKSEPVYSKYLEWEKANQAAIDFNAALENKKIVARRLFNDNDCPGRVANYSKNFPELNGMIASGLKILKHNSSTEIKSEFAVNK